MFKTQLCKSIRILLVSLTACGCALAQYGAVEAWEGARQVPVGTRRRRTVTAMAQ